jgi:hypothetical protein
MIGKNSYKDNRGRMKDSKCELQVYREPVAQIFKPLLQK